MHSQIICSAFCALISLNLFNVLLDGTVSARTAVPSILEHTPISLSMGKLESYTEKLPFYDLKLVMKTVRFISLCNSVHVFILSYFLITFLSFFYGV